MRPLNAKRHRLTCKEKQSAATLQPTEVMMSAPWILEICAFDMMACCRHGSVQDHYEEEDL